MMLYLIYQILHYKDLSLIYILIKHSQNQFVSVANTTTFSTSGVGTVGVTSTASFTLKYTDSLIDVVPDPTQPLFYNVERGGFISTADSTVIDYNQITFDNSKYDGSYSVVGVGTTHHLLYLYLKIQN